MKRLVYKKRANVFTVKMVIVSVIFLLLSLMFCLFGRFNASEDLTVSDSAYSDSLCVLIDAGHGGIDGGAEVDGIFEKNLNLSVSQKIFDFLSLYNVDCVMTRTDDSLLSDGDSGSRKRGDLLKRVKIAKSYESPIFVSIHMNKFPEEKYNGLQVFYSVNNFGSENLAKYLQEMTVKYIQPDNKRQIKPATTSIFVLDRLECPSVLVECGFMSNPDELNRLNDDEYQNKLAFVLSSAIMKYISDFEK